MSRQHSTPYLVTDTTSRSLQAVEDLDEKWLQKFIFAHPQSLPVDEIEPAFGPLIPVCRELGTQAGPVDVLFVNTAGLVTLVECKLWENPEARREVVGQILDYAKEISRWSYAELEEAVDKALNKREGRSLYELVSQCSEELDQSEFIDNVARYLKRGRFLLLIVGNGIRESVERIAEFLQEHAHLNFGFALIEVGVFRVPPDFGTGYFVQPRVIAQTIEIERAVVRIEDGKLVVESLSVQGEKPSARPKRTKISEQQFYDVVEVDKKTVKDLASFLERARGMGLTVQPGQNSLMLKYELGDKEFNFGVFKTDGSFQNYGIAASTDKIGHPEIGEAYLNKLASLLENAYVYKSSDRFLWTVKKRSNQYPTIPEC